MSLQLFTRSFI